MTSKEKVVNAINFKEGEVPLDIGGSAVSGIHCSCVEQLREYYGLEKRLVKIAEPYQMLGLVEEDLREAMGIDTEPCWNPYDMYGNFNHNQYKEWRTPWGQNVLVTEATGIKEDKDNVYIYPQGDVTVEASGKMPKASFFFDAQIRQNHFDRENMNIEDNLEEFGYVEKDVLGYLANLASEKSDKAKFANFGGTALGDIAMVPAVNLKDPKGVRDITEWYMTTLLHPEYVKELFERQVKIAINNLNTIYQVVGNNIDVLFICGTDFGTQTSQFLSPTTFNELYKPYYKKMNDWIHSNTTWKTFKHCCGSIDPLIPELIDSGFDILNPVQWSADKMDRKMLKQKYGKDVVFWGGGIDTQHTLPKQSKDQVKKEALECLKIFSEGGGFVYNTIHNIQAQTPVENIVALVEAVKEFNGTK